ncbi:MAG: type II secretion system protein GspD [Candidatus Omnitrophica bacterium]|nr:type II secretion system protein GspD [Candidatus Omnitrophota bacterium]
MRKLLIIILFLFCIPLLVYPDIDIDNIYGDHLITRAKKKVSMNLENVDLVDLLKILSQQTGLNFISTEAVQSRSITLYIENAPLKEAMDIIFKANHLSYDYYPEANMFIVKEMGQPGLELKTKVYKLKYTRVQRTRIQREIEEVISTDSDELEDEEGIVAAIERVLTVNGKVISEPLSNSIVVVDVPTQFPVIDDVIAYLDVPQPKVLIEVEMVDVSKQLMDKMGFQWGSGQQPGFTATVTGGAYDNPWPFPNRLLNSIAWSSTPERTLTLGTLDLTKFQAVMEFVKSDTDSKMLARPKILSLNNETSEVNLTTDEAIGLITTVSDSGTITQEIERTETGTKLRVTPQINLRTREVTLVLEVFTKTAEASGFVLTGTAAGTVMNPTQRGTKSVLRLNDNQTLLIGGLIREDKENTRVKVPFLGKIPFLGGAFRHKSKTDDSRELLIFLTPRIIDDDIYYSEAPQSIPREQSEQGMKRDLIHTTLDRYSPRR